MAAWWPLGSLLEASWDALGPQKTLSGAALGRPEGGSKTVFSDLGNQKAPRMEPQRVPNRAPKRLRAEMAEITKVAHSTQDLLGFRGPRSSYLSQKWGQNGSRIVSSTLKASESLLEASWSALGALRSRKKVIAIGSWAAMRCTRAPGRAAGQNVHPSAGGSGGSLIPFQEGKHRHFSRSYELSK